MDENKIKGWCELMAAGKELYLKAVKECGEVVHCESRELFFTDEFFLVLVETYKPKVIHYNPEWAKGRFTTGEEWFEVSLCGEKYKIFALWDLRRD